MRKPSLILPALLALSALVALASCIGPTTTPPKPAVIRIGTLPTEDSLPLWVAQRNGLFTKAGIKVSMYTFPSTTDLDKALSDGTIDAAQADLLVPAQLRSRGTQVRIVTIMLGTTPQQGRFGLVVPPHSKITSIRQLIGVPIATSPGHIQEYVLDGLMAEAGIKESQIKLESVNKIPVRFELLMHGQVPAAMLPDPLLSLAQQEGARLIADDTKGLNLSQTVLIFSQRYLDRQDGAEAVRRLLGVWDEAAARIDADPGAFRGLLVEKAGLPKALSTTYRVSVYPKHQLPTPAEVDRVLAWMKLEHELREPIPYGDLVWQPPAK